MGLGPLNLLFVRLLKLELFVLGYVLLRGWLFPVGLVCFLRDRVTFVALQVSTKLMRVVDQRLDCMTNDLAMYDHI